MQPGPACLTPVKVSDPMMTPSTTNLVAMKPKQISFSTADSESELATVTIFS